MQANPMLMMETYNEAAPMTNPNQGRALTEGAVSQGTSFRDLLADVVSGNIEQGVETKGNPFFLLQLLGQVTEMPNLQDDQDLALLLQQLATMLNEHDQELEESLLHNPDVEAWLQTAQVLLGLQGMDGSVIKQQMDSASEMSTKPETTQTVNRLLATLQLLQQQLTTNQGTTSEITALVRDFQQLLTSSARSALVAEAALEANQHHSTQSSQQHTRLLADLTASSTQAVHSTRTATVQEAGGQYPAQPQNEEVKQLLQQADTVKAGIMPRATLLRPEWLQAAYGQLTDQTTTETGTQLDSAQNAVAAPVGVFAESLKGATQPAPPNAVPTPQVPVGQFAEEMSRMITKSFTLSSMDGFTEAKISLVPEHLGQVDIKLTMHNGQLTAHIAAETMLGKDALEQQLGMLRNALHNQGIQVEKLEVTQQSQATASHFHDQRGQQSSQQQAEHRSKSRTAQYDDNPLDFQDEMEIIENQYGMTMRGGGFHATA